MVTSVRRHHNSAIIIIIIITVVIRPSTALVVMQYAKRKSVVFIRVCLRLLEATLTVIRSQRVCLWQLGAASTVIWSYRGLSSDALSSVSSHLVLSGSVFGCLKQRQQSFGPIGVCLRMLEAASTVTWSCRGLSLAAFSSVNSHLVLSGSVFGCLEQRQQSFGPIGAVSYTHLTLPTTAEV